MAGRSSDGVVGQVHRLFSVGAVGSMSDPQLLDQIVGRREQAAEAALEDALWGRSLAELHDHDEHDRLARQPDGPRAP
jgi:hypothetical protein